MLKHLGFYPTVNFGNRSDRILPIKNEGLGLFGIVCGSREGLNGAMAASYAKEILEFRFEKIRKTIEQCNRDSSASNLDNLQTIIYKLILEANEDLRAYINKHLSEIGDASVTFDLVLFLKHFAILCHVGHNRILVVEGQTVVSMTKVHNKYEKMRKEFEKTKDQSKIASLDHSLKNIATSRMGLGLITKLTVTPFALKKNGLFLILTQKATQELGIEIGPLKSFVDIISDSKTGDQVAKSLFELGTKNSKDPDIGVMAISYETTIEKEDSEQAFLKVSALDVFRDVRSDRNSLERIIALTKRVEFLPGKKLIEQGKSSDRFYILLDGIADVLLDDVVLFPIGPGDPIGDASVICDELYFTTCIAKSNVSALEIEKYHYENMVNRDLKLGLKIQNGITRTLAKKLVASLKKQAIFNKN